MAGPAFVERRFAHWSAHDFGDGGGRRDEKRAEAESGVVARLT